MTRLSREMPQMPPEQQAEMAAQMQAGALGPQHELMATQVGTHDVAIKSWMDPSAPPVESQGLATRTVHMGGGVLHEKFQGDMTGTPLTGLSRGESDNVSGKWWSTWTDSLSTGIVVAEGECDETERCVYVGCATRGSDQRIRLKMENLLAKIRWLNCLGDRFRTGIVLVRDRLVAALRLGG